MVTIPHGRFFAQPAALIVMLGARLWIATATAPRLQKAAPAALLESRVDSGVHFDAKSRGGFLAIPAVVPVTASVDADVLGVTVAVAIGVNPAFAFLVTVEATHA